MTILSAAQLFCRFLLSLVFLLLALDGLWISNWSRAHGIHGMHNVEWAAVTLLCSIILFAAVWLLFGVRTRVVALLGTLLSAGLVYWFAGFGIGSRFQLYLLLAACIATLPLLALGGGRFALYRRGWSQLT